MADFDMERLRINIQIMEESLVVELTYRHPAGHVEEIDADTIPLTMLDDAMTKARLARAERLKKRVREAEGTFDV